MTQFGKIILVIHAWPVMSELCESCQTTSVSWAETLVVRPNSGPWKARVWRQEILLKETSYEIYSISGSEFHLPGVNLNSRVVFVFLFSLQGGFMQSMILKLSESGCGPPETKTHKNYTVIIYSYHLISLYELHCYKNNTEIYEQKLSSKSRVK